MTTSPGVGLAVSKKTYHCLTDRGRMLADYARLRRLTQERLYLAAYLGDSDAASILGPLHRRASADLCECVRGLAPWGQIACVTAAYSAASYVCLVAQNEIPKHCCSCVTTVINAVGAWLPYHQNTQALAMLGQYRERFFREATVEPDKVRGRDLSYEVHMMVMMLLNAIWQEGNLVGSPSAAPRAAECAAAAVKHAKNVVAFRQIPQLHGTLDAAVYVAMITWALDTERPS